MIRSIGSCASCIISHLLSTLLHRYKLGIRLTKSMSYANQTRSVSCSQGLARHLLSCHYQPLAYFTIYGSQWKVDLPDSVNSHEKLSRGLRVPRPQSLIRIGKLQATFPTDQNYKPSFISVAGPFLCVFNIQMAPHQPTQSCNRQTIPSLV